MAKSKLLKRFSGFMATAMLLSGINFHLGTFATDNGALSMEEVNYENADSSGLLVLSDGLAEGGEVLTKTPTAEVQTDSSSLEVDVLPSETIGAEIPAERFYQSSTPEGSTFTASMPNAKVFEANFLTVQPDTATQFTSPFSMAASPEDGFYGFQFQANLNDVSDRPLNHYTGNTTEVNGVPYEKHLRFGGAHHRNGRFVYFNVPEGVTHARLYVVGMSNGDNDRYIQVRGGHNYAGEIIEELPFKGRDSMKYLDFPLPGGGNYTITPSADVQLFALRMEYTFENRPGWGTVQAPEITDVEYNITTANTSTVDFKWAGEISFNGADRIYGHLCNEYGGVLVSDYISNIGLTSGTFSLTIPTSGKFKVKLTSSRITEDEENVKESDFSEIETVILPLVAPEILNTDVRDQKSGLFVLKWSVVAEVDAYRVEYKLTSDEEWIALPDKDPDTREHEFNGLIEGESYDFRVTSIRDDDIGVSPVSTVVIEETNRKWIYQGVGKGGSYAGNLIIPYDKDGTPIQNGTKSVTVTENGVATSVQRPVYGIEGNEVATWVNEYLPSKILMEPDEGTKYTDGHNGFTYFYTEIDPEREHWSIEATFKLVNRYRRDALMNQITTKDGQVVEDTQTSFGIIATDIAPGHDYYPYFNSAAVAFGRLRYLKVDGTYQRVESAPGGIFKTGYSDPTGLASPSGHISFSVDTNTFDQYFNIDYTAGGYEHRFKTGDIYTMKMVKDNTGFRTYLLKGNGSTYSYDKITAYEPDMLVKQDKDRYYVGVFASRKIAVEITDMKFDSYEPKSLEEDPKEERPKIEMGASFKLDSTRTTGLKEYQAGFYSNLDGTVQIQNNEGSPISKVFNIKGKTLFYIPLALNPGKNTYRAEFIPFPDELQTTLEPEYTVTSTDPINIRFTITYTDLGDPTKALYVSQDGNVVAAGTKADPLDLNTAIAYCKPGQQIIVMGGSGITDPKSRYYLNSSINIARGNNNGTLMAEPGKTVVFDLGSSKNGGFTISGNGWHFYGFDICNAQIVGKPLLVMGNNNRIEKIRVYDNADTGLSVNGVSTEPFELWPRDNLIISCEVWNSCDIGLNNADGFTAKITVGNGNKFKYCISHHNIDDGWDLFAQATTGPIGEVTVEDCVAYSNGTTTNDKLTTGEGNGFKLGGTHTPGAHILKNSISFDNRNNGITSNSGSGVRLYNNTSIMNQNYGVNLYSNDISKQWHLVGNVYDAITVSKNIDSRYYSNNTSIDNAKAAAIYINANYQQTDPIVTYYNRDGSKFNEVDKNGKPISVDSLTGRAREQIYPVYEYAVDQPRHNDNGTIFMNNLFALKEKTKDGPQGADFSKQQPDGATIRINPEQDAVVKSGASVGGGGGVGGSGSVANTSSSDKNTGSDSTKSQATTNTDTLTVARAKSLAANAIKAVVSAAKSSGKSTKNLTATIKLRNVANISADVFKDITAVAKESGNKINVLVDTLSATGKSVDVRLTVDASKVTKAINLKASSTNATAKKATEKFNKFYSNTVAVINFGQSGNFGTTVRVAVKTKDTSKDSLNFYSYDAKTNKFKAIKNADYRVDKNGYVHFNTSVGGNIVISAGKLKRK